MKSEVYICIPVFNRLSYTIKCIESIKKQVYQNYQIIICDDASTDGTYDYIHLNYPEIVLLKGNGNLWWTGGTNKCVEYALSISNENDFVFTLNNDTELDDQALDILVNFSIKNKRCIVSCVNLFFNNSHKIEPSAFAKKNSFPFSLYHDFINRWGDELSQKKIDYEEADSLSGKGVLIPVEVFQKVGFYNFEKLPHYHADTEFIRRAKEIGQVKVFINYKAKVLSHQELSGIGQVNTEPNIREFINSFFTIKSANHLKTLWNRAQIIYKPFWRTYFSFNVLMIIMGFIKRYFSNLLKSK
jgi:GT2 family glycosyltransferase